MKIADWWKANRDTWVGTIFYIIGGFLAALVFYWMLGVVFQTSTPIVSVFSQSMEHDGMPLDEFWEVQGSWYEEKGTSKEIFTGWPFNGGFNKGDMLLVVGPQDLEIGDVIVFNSGRFSYPIIHRIIGITEEGYQTKGDHNPSEDGWVISETNIYGKAVFSFPYLGWVKIVFSELTGLA